MIKSITSNFKTYLPVIPLIGGCVYLVLGILSQLSIAPFSAALWYDLEIAAAVLFATSCFVKFLMSHVSFPENKIQKMKSNPSTIQIQSGEQSAQLKKQKEELEKRKKEMIDHLVKDASQDDKLFFELWELLFNSRSQIKTLTLSLPSCLMKRFHNHIENVRGKDIPGVRCMPAIKWSDDGIDYRDRFVLRKFPCKYADLEATPPHLYITFFDS